MSANETMIEVMTSGRCTAIPECRQWGTAEVGIFNGQEAHSKRVGEVCGGLNAELTCAYGRRYECGGDEGADPATCWLLGWVKGRRGKQAASKRSQRNDQILKDGMELRSPTRENDVGKRSPRVVRWSDLARSLVDMELEPGESSVGLAYSCGWWAIEVGLDPFSKTILNQHRPENMLGGCSVITYDILASCRNGEMDEAPDEHLVNWLKPYSSGWAGGIRPNEINRAISEDARGCKTDPFTRPTEMKGPHEKGPENGACNMISPLDPRPDLSTTKLQARSVQHPGTGDILNSGNACRGGERDMPGLSKKDHVSRTQRSPAVVSAPSESFWSCLTIGTCSDLAPLTLDSNTGGH
ncbi:hypothetical protein V8F33_009743 [Rhypophila sp. PSN 637]